MDFSSSTTRICGISREVSFAAVLAPCINPHRTSLRDWFTQLLYATCSPNSRQLHNKFRSAIFFRYDADSAAVALHNWGNDGEPQAGAAFKFRLQRLKNLGTLFGVQAYSGVGEGDAQPKRF